MVGALADWFAVTALFRHPLGLPIPHTALIKRKKDQIGDQLGGFIEENFMVPALIEERAAALELPRRMSTWFADPANAPRVSDEAARMINLAAEMLEDGMSSSSLTAAVRWAAEPEWSQPLGRILEQLVENRLEPMLQLGADRATVGHWAAWDSSTASSTATVRSGCRSSPRTSSATRSTKGAGGVHPRRWPATHGRLALLGAISQFANDLRYDETIAARGRSRPNSSAATVTSAASTAWKAGKGSSRRCSTTEQHARNTIHELGHPGFRTHPRR